MRCFGEIQNPLTEIQIFQYTLDYNGAISATYVSGRCSIHERTWREEFPRPNNGSVPFGSLPRIDCTSLPPYNIPERGQIANVDVSFSLKIHSSPSGVTFQCQGTTYNGTHDSYFNATERIVIPAHLNSKFRKHFLLNEVKTYCCNYFRAVNTAGLLADPLCEIEWQ